MVIAVAPNGTDHGVYAYTLGNASVMTGEGISWDANHEDYLRLTGTVENLASPECLQGVDNPDCGHTLADVAWSGRVFSDPNDANTTVATPAAWRTFRDSSKEKTFGWRVTGALAEESFFLLARAFDGAVSRPLLVKVSVDESSWSGVRYGPDFTHDWDISPASIAYVPSGPGTQTEGLLIGNYPTPGCGSAKNLVRTDLAGASGACQTDVTIRSQTISPTRSNIDHTSRTWTMSTLNLSPTNRTWAVEECSDYYSLGPLPEGEAAVCSGLSDGASSACMAEGAYANATH